MKKLVILAALLALLASAEMFLFTSAVKAKIGFGGIDCDSWGYWWKSGDWDKSECVKSEDVWWRNQERVLKSIGRLNGSENKYLIQYRHSYDSKEVYEANILITGLSVRLRTDSKDYTSILFTESTEGDLRDYMFQSAIIFVPKKEDVKIWQEWIDKQIEKVRPRRVLPPE